VSAAVSISFPALSTIVVISEDPSRPARLGAAHARVRTIDFNEYLGDISPSAAPPDVELSSDDDATMFYTSGTTGHPKGAVGTHRNAITNLMNLFFVGSRATMRFGAGNFDESGESIPNAALLSVPLFHATGCLATMITATASGGKLVMMHHFDAGQALALMSPSVSRCSVACRRSRCRYSITAISPSSTPRA